MFEKERIVKLGETDAAGRLYFLTPLNWCQEIFEEFLLSKSYKISDMLESDYQTPVVSVQCDFFNSCCVSDGITVRIENIKKNNSSFKVSYVISSMGRLISKCEITHVCVSQKTGKSIPIPEKIAASLNL